MTMSSGPGSGSGRSPISSTSTSPAPLHSTTRMGSACRIRLGVDQAAYRGGRRRDVLGTAAALGRGVPDEERGERRRRPRDLVGGVASEIEDLVEVERQLDVEIELD